MSFFRFPPWVVILMWVPVFLVSLNHLIGFSKLLILPMRLCGALYFFALIGTLFYLIRPYFSEALFAGAVFFMIGWLNGPFMEPPGDPLDHLAEAYGTCNQYSDKAKRANGGLWHYSMNGILLCSDNPISQSPERVLTRTRFLHSVMVAFLAVGLYAVGKSVGLSPFWAGFGVIVTVLFMGTNRFSYFGYYSLADSASSLLIYWLWIAAFFFKTNQTVLKTFLALVSAACLIPILYVNHVQEAIFLGFICVVYLAIRFSEFILGLNNKTFRLPVVLIVVVVLVMLPQFDWFRNLLSPFFMLNDWEKNQHLVLFWGPIHLMGKVWSFRVNDTLGLMGFIMLPAAIAIVWMAKREVISYKVAIVGMLPLLVYCTPLLNYIWLSNCKWLPSHTRYYYRICYASLFGVTFAYLLHQMEQRIVLKTWFSDKAVPFFKSFCLIGIILLSTIRSGPVYGKMDFLTMDTNPWWPQWQPMLENLSKQNRSGKPIFTDAITGWVLESVFNYPILEKWPRPRDGYVDLGTLPPREKSHTLANFKGFTPSWVPVETRHWNATIANTTQLYIYQGKQGKQANKVLKLNPLQGVQVFK